MGFLILMMEKERRTASENRNHHYMSKARRNTTTKKRAAFTARQGSKSRIRKFKSSILKVLGSPSRERPNTAAGIAVTVEEVQLAAIPVHENPVALGRLNEESDDIIAT